MNMQDWFLYGTKRKFISTEVDYSLCNMGIRLVEDPGANSFYTLDPSDSTYTAIRGSRKWASYGAERGWLLQVGCMKHELLECHGRVLQSESEIVPMDLDYVSDVFLAEYEREAEELGIKTGGWSNSVNKNEVGYLASHIADAQRLIDEAWSMRVAHTFIDIGCGLGLPLALAQEDGRYAAIVGVEHDINILSNCVDNAPYAELLREDASTFKLRGNYPKHIYLYSPFSNQVFINFMDNNVNHIKSTGSIILYNNSYAVNHLMPLYGFNSRHIDGISSIYY